MIDPAVLKAHKVSAEDYKAKFTGEIGEKTKKLIALASDRCRSGLLKNLTDARIWWAVDKAYDTPFYQTSHTLLRGLLDRKMSDEKILSACNEFGLTHLLTDIPCGCTTPTCKCVKQKKLDLPVFFQVLIPLVQAYVKIRWAKIYNDHDVFPVFKFEPLKLTAKDMMRAELLTDRGQLVSAQYGYGAIKRQIIFQQLLYSICLQFPMECWHQEKQLVKNGDGYKEKVVKEGLRYALPHPSRTFYDMAHRPDTLNSDTGCRYAGYWTIQPYGDIADNAAYWNKDQITYGGTNWLFTSAFTGPWSYYSQLYPCTINFPTSSGGSSLDRETTQQFYSTNEQDKAVVSVEMFMKFAPSQYGLADYDFPLWHRLVLANDATVLYCEPLAYSPGIYYGYDADGNRAMNAGMGLEIMPFQDLVGNYLTQYLLSVKKNLRNVVFYDPQIVDSNNITKLQNYGDKVYTDTIFIEASKRELGWAQTGTREAFWPVTFPQQNTTEIAGVVRAIIEILERVLVFSSQEIGQAASHEQSAGEVHIIDKSTGNRVSFTSSFFDDGCHAWKRQLYDGIMAYSNDEIFGQIANLNDARRKVLEDLGFKVEEDPAEGETHAGVYGPKSALAMDGIASTRDGVKRINTPAIAANMVQLTQSLVSIPTVVESVGIKQIVDWYNQIAVLSGMPSDFKITVKKDVDPEQQVNDVKEQLAGLQEQMGEVAQQVVNQNMEQLAKTMKESVIDPIQSAMSQLAQSDQAQTEILAKQSEAIKQLDEIVRALAMPAPQPPLPDAYSQPAASFPGGPGQDQFLATGPGAGPLGAFSQIPTGAI